MGFAGAWADTVGLSGNLSKPGPGIRLQQLRDPGMIGETTQTPAPGKTEQSVPEATPAPEIGGRDGPDPTRYGDWEKNGRSEEHTSELQSLMRISYAVFC